AVLHVCLHVGALDGPALPLRPGDEARLAEASAPRHWQPDLLRDPHRVAAKTHFLTAMAYTVERKPLTLLERIYIPQILAGMRVTLKHLFAPNVTMEYPEQRPAIPTGYRGVPTLVKDPHGREKCVSCQLCEFVCPPKAIRIQPGEIPENAATAHVEKGPKAFD